MMIFEPDDCRKSQWQQKMYRQQTTTHVASPQRTCAQGVTTSALFHSFSWQKLFARRMKIDTLERSWQQH